MPYERRYCDAKFECGIFLLLRYIIVIIIKRMLESSILSTKRTFRTFLFSLLSLYRMKNPSPE